MAFEKILFISHTHWESEFVVGSHHLARELAKSGYHVARMVTPLSLAHALFKNNIAGNSLVRWLHGPEAVADHNGVLNLRASTWLPAQWSTGASAKRLLSLNGMCKVDMIFIDQPLMFGKWVFDLGSPVIYRRTDIYTRHDYIRKEAKWVPQVDGVVATSKNTLMDLRVDSLTPTKVIPNGVEVNHFARAFRPWGERDGVIYVGALDNRFDWNSLQGIASRLPQLHFTIVGPCTNTPRMPANITFTGAIPYQDLPELIARHRVALLPFSSARENLGRSPMKLFEFIAAGLHIVVSNHFASLPVGCESLVSIYSDLDTAALMVFSAHNMPDSRLLQERVIDHEDWSEKARELISFGQEIAEGIAN